MNALNKSRRLLAGAGMTVLAFSIDSPVLAERKPTTPQQLKQYEDAFMEEVEEKETFSSTAMLKWPRRSGSHALHDGDGVRHVPPHGCRYASRLLPQISANHGQIRRPARYGELVYRKADAG